MLNDVIGYTTFQSLLDVHLLEMQHSWGKVLAVFFWIGVSIILGYGIGLVTALLCKYTGEHPALQQTEAPVGSLDIDHTLYSTDFAVMFLSPWIAYLLAEAFDLSAILTIFFCGLSLGHFAIYNLSSGCRSFTAKTYSAISEICESISFIYIGVAFYGFGIKSE